VAQDNFGNIMAPINQRPAEPYTFTGLGGAKMSEEDRCE
jgi:hypothetical protein